MFLLVNFVSLKVVAASGGEKSERNNVYDSYEALRLEGRPVSRLRTSGFVNLDAILGKNSDTVATSQGVLLQNRER